MCSAIADSALSFSSYSQQLELAGLGIWHMKPDVTVYPRLLSTRQAANMTKREKTNNVTPLASDKEELKKLTRIIIEEGLA